MDLIMRRSTVDVEVAEVGRAERCVKYLGKQKNRDIRMEHAWKKFQNYFRNWVN